jgi:hypothetical protein
MLHGTLDFPFTSFSTLGKKKSNKLASQHHCHIEHFSQRPHHQKNKINKTSPNMLPCTLSLLIYIFLVPHGVFFNAFDALLGIPQYPTISFPMLPSL